MIPPFARFWVPSYYPQFFPPPSLSRTRWKAGPLFLRLAFLCEEGVQGYGDAAEVECAFVDLGFGCGLQDQCEFLPRVNDPDRGDTQMEVVPALDADAGKAVFRGEHFNAERWGIGNDSGGEAVC